MESTRRWRSLQPSSWVSRGAQGHLEGPPQQLQSWSAAFFAAQQLSSVPSSHGDVLQIQIRMFILAQRFTQRADWMHYDELFHVLIARHMKT